MRALLFYFALMLMMAGPALGQSASNKIEVKSLTGFTANTTTTERLAVSTASTTGGTSWIGITVYGATGQSAPYMRILDATGASVFTVSSYGITCLNTLSGEMYNYENAELTPIDTANVYHAVSRVGLHSDGLAGFTFHTGVIGAFATATNYSTVVAGTTLFSNTAAHNLVTGDYITVHASTNYDGVYRATVVNSLSFYVSHTYIATQTGTFARGARLVADSGCVGHFFLSFQCTALAGSGNNKLFKLEAFKNTTPLDNTSGQRLFANATDYGQIVGMGLVHIDPGDHVWMAVQNKTDDADFLPYILSMCITK